MSLLLSRFLRRLANAMSRTNQDEDCLVVSPPLYQVSRRDTTINRCLGTPHEIQAISYFFKSFATIPHSSQCTGIFLELLIPFWQKTNVSSMLHDAISAVALSTLSKLEGKGRFEEKALTMYNSAIRKTTYAINDSIKQKSNETIVSVLSLAMFEVE